MYRYLLWNERTVLTHLCIKSKMESYLAPAWTGSSLSSACRSASGHGFVSGAEATSWEVLLKVNWSLASCKQDKQELSKQVQAAGLIPALKQSEQFPGFSFVPHPLTMRKRSLPVWALFSNGPQVEMNQWEKTQHAHSHVSVTAVNDYNSTDWAEAGNLTTICNIHPITSKLSMQREPCNSGQQSWLSDSFYSTVHFICSS